MTHPFDKLAPTYDNDFTHTQLGAYLRARVHGRLLNHFHANQHILEIGCGTGEDALFLAQHGIRVTATDASPAMLAVARHKAQAEALIRFEQLDLGILDTSDWDSSRHNGEGSGVRFSGAFSNFGALNCLSDWQPLAAWLAAHIETGGIVGLGIMAPFCLWEAAWHGLHLDFRVARRRLRGDIFQPAGSISPIEITYPTIRRITRDFAPYFRRRFIMPLGLCIPPSDVFGVIEKRPRLLRTLIALEDHLGGIPQLALFADHYWIEFERTKTE
jgi:SAM-dependent methyltransferase